MKAVFLIAVGGAALAGGIAFSYQSTHPGPCRVIDGDTIACGSERIRLNGIDAPELHACRPGRECVPGDPVEATNTLRQGMSMGLTAVERLGTDRYGRTIAEVHAGPYDLSCWQLAYGSARYIARWDELGRVHQTCGGF